jgi:hypothetical protein
VDDDVVDVALFGEPLEHPLECWSVALSGGLAGIDLLLDDLGADSLGLSVARLVALR